jgi:hypothetical protein
LKVHGSLLVWDEKERSLRRLLSRGEGRSGKVMEWQGDGVARVLGHQRSRCWWGCGG